MEKCVICYSENYALVAIPMRECNCDYMICDLCSDQVTKCPLCRGEIYGFAFDMAKSLLDEMDRSAPYSCRECKEELKRCDYLKHNCGKKRVLKFKEQHRQPNQADADFLAAVERERAIGVAVLAAHEENRKKPWPQKAAEQFLGGMWTVLVGITNNINDLFEGMAKTFGGKKLYYQYAILGIELAVLSYQIKDITQEQQKQSDFKK